MFCKACNNSMPFINKRSSNVTFFHLAGLCHICKMQQKERKEIPLDETRFKNSCPVRPSVRPPPRLPYTHRYG